MTAEIINPRDLPRMPNLSQLSEEEFSTLHQDINRLQQFYNYDPNWLGPVAQYYHTLRQPNASAEAKQQAQSQIDLFNQLKEKYPWFQSKPTPEQVKSNHGLLSFLSDAHSGSATSNPSADLEHTLKETFERKYTIDYFQEEFLRRATQPPTNS